MVNKLNPTPVVQGMRDFSEKNRVIRRCKIIGTIGPSSAKDEVLKKLIDLGMNVARLNFSHGSHEDHLEVIQKIRLYSKELGRNVTILQDLQGPKIRCGKLLGDQMVLKEGQTLRLIYGEVQTDSSIIPIDYRDLVLDVRVGDRVMMDDGLLILSVVAIEDQAVTVKVSAGGILKNRKGVNFPDSKLSLPALTEKDTKDLLFGVSHNVDVIALSFVQSADDVRHCKKIIAALGADIPVISKIEKLSAIEHIDEIAEVSDGLMVARGDLGVEGNMERVPAFQRKIIHAARERSIPVIIATQMLESMVKNPRPSSAEVTDVANAVLEGADCVMLSAEVASGSYPVECVSKMIDIIQEVEAWASKKPSRYHGCTTSQTWQEHTAIAISACEAADSINAKAIVCLTLTGSIAKLISSWRPRTPIIAISPRHDVIQRLGFTWGVYGMRNTLFYNTDILLQDLPQLLKSLHIVNSGDLIVITAGIPINQIRPTNMIKINQIS